MSLIVRTALQKVDENPNKSRINQAMTKYHDLNPSRFIDVPDAVMEIFLLE